MITHALLTKLCFVATSLWAKGVFPDIFDSFDKVSLHSPLLKLKQLGIGEKYYDHAFTFKGTKNLSPTQG